MSAKGEKWAQTLLQSDIGRVRGRGDRRYTVVVKSVVWDPSEVLADQLTHWCRLGDEPGVVHVVFEGQSDRDEPLDWPVLERWTRSRAVTVADVRSTFGGSVLAAALCADAIYLRRGVDVLLDAGEPSPGLVWALGRAGRAALARGLLDDRPITADEAVRIGLANGVLDDEEAVPTPDGASLAAMTTARDVMRVSVDARPVLELVSFRLLFSSGDPKEGAKAFLERRDPVFDDPEGR